jgi:glycosyltransferase involved in cell wall biosynthesis
VVTLLGQVEDMAACLESVDLVVLPSYREGLPRSLIEAAAAGLPVIASDAPGCRDAVAHGETGLLVPARDPAALAAAIGELCARPELRARMGAAGRQRVLREFDERLVIESTLAVYREWFPA